ncbi:MAG: division/cell wall cluster transcriptional repressor MraZ [Candidatus Omnitrophica bacterium]|nr:division/cell wall cluster transcriptional repressor MraZ [Candidatus Omnitrophota bacterium]MBU1996792.1 division/cell wall cluster transcriptional repressor MraZ [Candidatus Omnitrophota bacterium]
MFYGEFKHSIDEKGRVILPSKFRDVSREYAIEKFFLTRGLDKCIFMFGENEWTAQEEKFKKASFTKKENRNFNRMFFAGAVDVFPDKQGRFIIPQYLKDYASISKDIVVIGVSNRIEIWDRNKWSDFYSNSSDSFEQVAENILDL